MVCDPLPSKPSPDLNHDSEIEYFMKGHHRMEVRFPTSKFLFQSQIEIAVLRYMDHNSELPTSGIVYVDARYISFLSLSSPVTNSLLTVLVAMRVYALYGGRKFIRRALFLSGSLFLLSGITIVTLGQLADNS